MEYAERIRRAAEWVAAARHLVAFTGAGISTESGIPDFRGPDGVWTRRDKGLPPPPMPALVEPNRGHRALVALQDSGRLKFLVSQNVDNLHRRSGIRDGAIAELHGNGDLMRCLKCDGRFPLAEVGWDRDRWGTAYRTEKPRPGQPACRCGGRLISSIVNFGDPLPERDWRAAFDHAGRADVFLAVGSSLVVTPAADLPRRALDGGAKLILVNQGATPLDDEADLLFREPAGEVLTDMVSRAVPGG
ncbi:MAG: Sir2 family NAD-dependent protein deacetylase [Planctomycetes bacterium]|nr:Sir2 family NAD-dependent protein deacetylase [Planctomycetota bacterium]